MMLWIMLNNADHTIRVLMTAESTKGAVRSEMMTKELLESSPLQNTNHELLGTLGSGG